MRDWRALVGWILGAAAYAALTSELGCATTVEPPVGAGVAIGEGLCPAYGFTCGKVYEFETPADNPLGLVELCVIEKDLAAASRIYGRARLSTDSRFDEGNLCVWQCPSAKGCNSYGGCFCEVGVPLSVWTIRFDGACDAHWQMPATGCSPLRIADYDGCHWRCVSILDLPRGVAQ